MPSIRDFSGGVLNQELQNRDNGTGVLFDCRNVLSSWNGELRKRTGTRFLKDLPSEAKLIPYRLQNGDDAILVLNNQKIKVYAFDEDDNLVPYMGSFIGEINAFPNPWTADSNTSGDWTVSSNFVDHQYDYAYFKGGWLINPTEKEQLYIHNSSDAFALQQAHLVWSVGLGEGKRIPKEVIFQYSDDGENWTNVKADITNTQQYNGTDLFSYWVYECDVVNDYNLSAHKYWKICVTDFENSISGTTICSLYCAPTCFAGTLTALEFDNCPYTNTDFANIRWSQNGTDLMMACKGKQPYKISCPNHVFTDGVFTPSDDSDFWENNGYPSSVIYYQNRLWFGGFSGGTDEYLTRVCGSEFGEFSHFKVPSQDIQATSAIQIDGTEISSVIENMFGGNQALYCLSADGVSMIDAQGGIVATDQIEFKLRNREPVDAMVPTVKDDIMIYLGRDKRKILITDYDFVVQRFKAHCISDSYMDFLSSGIKELHYIPRKSSLIYGVLEDGNMFALLFDMDKSKNSLFPFTTFGQVADLQPIKRKDETKLLAVTMLESGRWVLEEKLPQPDKKIMDFMSAEEKKQYTDEVIGSSVCYLDHSISRHYDDPVMEITNLPYSAGEKVSVIADGQYLGEFDVESRGSNILYAWETLSGNVIYTDAQNPSTTSTVYNKDYSIMNNYSISSVTVVEQIVTSIQVYHPFAATFLGYERVDSITVATEEGVSPQISGEFTRYEAGDTTISNTVAGETETFDGAAWKQENTIIYTVKANRPVEGMYYCTATSGTDLLTSDHYIDEINQTTVVYLMFGGGSVVYDSNNQSLGTATSYSDSSLVFDSKYYYRTTTADRNDTVYTTDSYSRAETKNMEAFTGYVSLYNEANDIVMGHTYDSYAVLKFVSPYNMRKFPKEISVNFINSAYLEVGNTFDSLKSVLNNFVESVNINNNKVLMNGNYTKTFDKQTFETPYVIVRSDKGLPFIITGIDYKVDMSNYQGGV